MARPVTIKVRKGRSTDGISEKHVAHHPQADPDPRRGARGAESPGVRPALEGAAGQAAHRLVELRAGFRTDQHHHGVDQSRIEETGEVRETHRRPNLAPFLDDPDCWLVASIEDYDLETNTAKPGPIFTERVIAPPPSPVITSAADALAVVLNERGHVDPTHIAELLHAMWTP